MARIAIVSSHPPFAEGGHVTIARELVKALQAEGHEADIILTPQNRFGRQGAAYLANWLTDVGVAADGDPIDQVITLRYPSYAVRHRKVVCWLNHTMREYYDLWDRFVAPLSWKNRIKERVRRGLIRSADRYLLGSRLSKLFVQSATIQRRVQRYLGLSSEVLYPPAPERPYRTDSYDPYVLCVSRLAPMKRPDLVLRALATPPAQGIACVMLGAGEEADALRRLANELGVADRVKFEGHANEASLVDHLARCRAVCFPPYEEDFGFVTVEACSAGKPTITCRDSGGPAEIIRHDQEGLVCDPTPDSLGRAMRALMDDEALARRMGESARRRVADWTWSQTVRKLVIV